MRDIYRETDLSRVQAQPPQPSCPCGMSPETKAAMNPVGGWCHTEECIAWHAANKEKRHVKR